MSRRLCEVAIRTCGIITSIEVLDDAMKTSMILYLAVVFVTPVWAQQKEIPQGIVSTGRVVTVSKESGSLTLRSQQVAKDIIFRGLQTVPVYFSTGRRGSFADIEPDQPATLYHSPSGRHWVISKIIIPDPEQSKRTVQAVTPAEPISSGRRGTFHVPRVPNTFR